MNRIRLLPEQVANQIAAGEVVERPASVVKELVENALDAEATRLTVEVQAGGRSLVRVTDNGTGMNKDDALLSLERHATSKIREAADLAGIATMGFRGEAVPSIASVSRMTLTTQERDTEESATQIVIHGGKIIKVGTAGAPAGTCMEVRQIFYNLPARRKFLRSEETEYGHIHHYLTLAALARPDVAFTFVRDGRTVWQLASVPTGPSVAERLTSLRERMRQLSGLEDQLIPVELSREVRDPFRPEMEEGLEEGPSSHEVRIWGLIGRPGVSRATRQDQHLFVNRRPVENIGLNRALLEGYHTSLMKGRYPVCCLFLELEPSRVDVNIHPAKREVKFHQERAVRQTLADAVRDALLGYHQGHGMSASQDSEATAVEGAPQENPMPQPVAPEMRTEDLPGLPDARPAVMGRYFQPDRESARSGPTRSTEPDRATHEGAPGKQAGVAPPDPTPERGASMPVLGRDEPKEEPSFQPAPGNRELPLLNVPLRLVGVVGRLYVVLESDRGMVLMDQHAAHERILFEKMLNQLQQGAAASQRLLLPETVEVPLRDAQFLHEHLEALNRMGVGLSEFGERTFLLDALPPFVKVADPRQFALLLVDELRAAGEGVNMMRLGEQVIAKTVCRHAVKANDPLAAEELNHLVEDLRQCAMPYTCPHGRPTLIEFSSKELEKRFGRTV